MTIDPNVQRIARQWAGTSTAFASLAQAVVTSEGNILKAVQCSEPSVDSVDEALMVLCRSGCHAMADWIASLPTDQRKAFVEFWAARWAPVGVSNDPTSLNANWPVNVEKLWMGSAL